MSYTCSRRYGVAGVRRDRLLKFRGRRLKQTGFAVKLRHGFFRGQIGADFLGDWRGS